VDAEFASISWQVGLTVASAIGAVVWCWVVFFVRREVKRIDKYGVVLQALQRDLDKNYYDKSEVNRITTSLEKRIDDGFNKLDTKLDLVFERIDRKQDKP